VNNLADLFFSESPMFSKSQQEESATFIFKTAKDNNYLGKVRLSKVLTEAAETTER
jgi:hypothetical protein